MYEARECFLHSWHLRVPSLKRHQEEEDGSLHSLVFVLVVYFDRRQQWQRERERERERGRERDTPGEKVYYRPGEVACFFILPLLSLSLALSTSVKGRLSQVPRIRSLISLKVYRWNERIVSNSSWISRRSYEEEMHVYLEKG